MRRHFLICLFLAASVGLNAQALSWQETIDVLKKYTWTDGYEFLNYADADFAKSILGQDIDYQRFILLFGGTFHEGGSYLIIEHVNNEIILRESPWFPPDSKIDIDTTLKIMLIRNATDNKLKGLLKAKQDIDEVRKMLKINILRLTLAGSYADNSGHLYSISATDFVANGLPTKSNSFKLGSTNDIPAPIMLFDNVNYAVDKTPTGLTLTTAIFNDDDNSFTINNHANSLILNRLTTDTDYFYPLVSEEYFTLPELIIYGGSTFSQTGIYTSETMTQHLLEALSTMRNEIFARHGYAFKSPKWQRLFATKRWYKPTNANVDNALTDIEKANIQLIQEAERRFQN